MDTRSTAGRPAPGLARRPFLLGALASAAAAGCARAEPTEADFRGEWSGVLELGSQRLRLKLVVRETGVALHSLDQGGAAIPAKGVRIDGARLRLEFPSIRAAYDGRLQDGRLVGTFTQGAPLPLVFERGVGATAASAPLDAAGLAALRAQAGAPALAVAALGRERRLSLAEGVRAAGRTERATPADLWHLGSVTKSMTATLVARCVEAGLVGWDDTVGAVLGAALPDLRAEYRDASFLHLLSHRSGLPAAPPPMEMLRYAPENPDPRAERMAFAGRVLAQAPEAAKAEGFRYSNSGYVVAGAMLEARLGAPWEALIRRHVFDPLGMRSAGFGAPRGAGDYDQPLGHAAGPLGDPSPRKPGEMADNPAVLGPAGRVHATLDDVLAFLGVHREPGFLSADALRTLHTPPFGGDYALGWVVRPDGLWHNGSNTFWYAEVLVDPARKLVAAAVANDGRLPTAAPAVGAALRGAADAVA